METAATALMWALASYLSLPILIFGAAIIGVVIFALYDGWQEYRQYRKRLRGK